jgi:hypothetical protein
MRWAYAIAGVLVGAVAASAAFFLVESHPPLPRDELTFMRLENGAGLSPGPLYTLTIHANGDVEYFGHENVSARGRRMGRVSEADVSALLRRFERADFLLRRETCEQLATDSKGMILTLEMRGRSKVVGFFQACDPNEVGDLLEIADAMNDAANVDQWLEFRYR